MGRQDPSTVHFGWWVAAPCCVYAPYMAKRYARTIGTRRCPSAHGRLSANGRPDRSTHRPPRRELVLRLNQPEVLACSPESIQNGGSEALPLPPTTGARRERTPREEVPGCRTTTPGTLLWAQLNAVAPVEAPFGCGVCAYLSLPDESDLSVRKARTRRMSSTCDTTRKASATLSRSRRGMAGLRMRPSERGSG